MTRRALWKGKLNGPGVDCGVALYSALSSDEKVSFHIVNRKTETVSSAALSTAKRSNRWSETPRCADFSSMTEITSS